MPPQEHHHHHTCDLEKGESKKRKRETQKSRYCQNQISNASTRTPPPHLWPGKKEKEKKDKEKKRITKKWVLPKSDS